MRRRRYSRSSVSLPFGIALMSVEDRERPQPRHRPDEVVGDEDPETFVDPVVVEVGDDGRCGVLVAKAKRGVARWIRPGEAAASEVSDDAAGAVRGGVQRLVGPFGRDTYIGRGSVGAWQ